ncbi:MAG: sigma-70 family RNA polymerase sigma factor [Candidatus Eremiobacteraeota bacterium]|nr:sigma-70 family RNA polymerase sigma factor [Candidatus Eremiobacteraeota bacterium]
MERGLVERARSEDAALEALVAAMWPQAFRLAASILRDRGLAEDVAQDACAAIVRSLPALKNPGAFPAWFYKIVVRHALSEGRRRRPAEPLEALQRRCVNDPSDFLALEEAMASLTPLARAVVLLHYYAGFSSVEIGESTQLPASTVRFHLMLARRALRKALSATRAPDLLAEARDNV